MGFMDFMRQNWGWIASFGSLALAGFLYLFGQMMALKRGVQAILRAQMINDYNRYSEKGFAPIYAKESFENCWIQYEKLGKNGVMSDIHAKFLALPTQDRRTNA